MAHARRDGPLVPSVAVKLNGQPLVAGMALWVTSVVVEDDVDVPSMFTLDLLSQQDERGTTPWTDDDRLALGATVEISMGYANDREVLIVGEITALEPSFSIAAPPTLSVRGYDLRHRLNTVRRTRDFTDRKDSDIAEEVCKDPNVSIESTDSVVTHPYVLQADLTDLEFLVDRAKRMHYEIVMDGATLLFRPASNDASSTVTLTFQDDLLEFRPRLALLPLTELRLVSWDPKEKQTISASASAGNKAVTMGGRQSAAQHAETVVGTAVETLVRAPAASQAEADQSISGRFDAASLDFIRGDGRLLGRTDIRAGRVIRLEGLGTRFSGEYYLTSVVHRYSRRDGYHTDFQARRNAS